jgi:hypothetical protein
LSEAGAATFNSTIAATSATFVPSSGENVVITRDGAGPYFGTSSNHSLRLITNNTSRVGIEAGGNITFNDSGADADFRVESDTQSHMLFVDGGSNKVGIGNSSPTTALDVTGTVTADGLVVSTTLGDTPASIVTTTGGSFLEFTDANTTAGRSPLVGAITDGLSFYTSAGSYSQKLGIDSLGGITGTSQAGGHVVFNEGGVDADFRVESAATLICCLLMPVITT